MCAREEKINNNEKKRKKYRQNVEDYQYNWELIRINRSHRRISGDIWVAENPRRFYAIAGSTYVYSPMWTTLQMVLVDMTIPHMDFKFSSMHDDIGLFRVTIMCIYKLYVVNKINERNKK